MNLEDYEWLVHEPERKESRRKKKVRPQTDTQGPHLACINWSLSSSVIITPPVSSSSPRFSREFFFCPVLLRPSIADPVLWIAKKVKQRQRRAHRILKRFWLTWGLVAIGVQWLNSWGRCPSCSASRAPPSAGSPRSSRSSATVRTLRGRDHRRCWLLACWIDS